MGKTAAQGQSPRQQAIEPDQQQRIYDATMASLAGARFLLFADYNYGALPQPLVRPSPSGLAKLKVMMAADSQASSQISDISRFQGMSLITPTSARHAWRLRDPEAGLAVVADRTATGKRCDHVMSHLAPRAS